MIALSPVLLLASAGTLLDGARRDGRTAPLAEQFLSQVGRGIREGTRGRWDAAFVHHAGYWSHFDHRAGKSSWPLPATASCDDLAHYARDRRALSDEAPEAGEVFLLWSPAKDRFVHAGIVVAAERFDVGGREAARYECLTIEGNVTPTGCLGGDRLARVRRMLAPGRGDRTIRWTELEWRATVPRVVPNRQPAGRIA